MSVNSLEPSIHESKSNDASDHRTVNDLEQITRDSSHAAPESALNYIKISKMQTDSITFAKSESSADSNPIPVMPDLNDVEISMLDGKFDNIGHVGELNQLYLNLKKQQEVQSSQNSPDFLSKFSKINEKSAISQSIDLYGHLIANVDTPNVSIDFESNRDARNYSNGHVSDNVIDSNVALPISSLINVNNKYVGLVETDNSFIRDLIDYDDDDDGLDIDIDRYIDKYVDIKEHNSRFSSAGSNYSKSSSSSITPNLTQKSQVMYSQSGYLESKPSGIASHQFPPISPEVLSKNQKIFDFDMLNNLPFDIASDIDKIVSSWKNYNLNKIKYGSQLKSRGLADILASYASNSSVNTKELQRDGANRFELYDDEDDEYNDDFETKSNEVLSKPVVNNSGLNLQLPNSGITLRDHENSLMPELQISNSESLDSLPSGLSANFSSLAAYTGKNQQSESTKDKLNQNLYMHPINLDFLQKSTSSKSPVVAKGPTLENIEVAMRSPRTLILSSPVNSPLGSPVKSPRKSPSPTLDDSPHSTEAKTTGGIKGPTLTDITDMTSSTIVSRYRPNSQSPSTDTSFPSQTSSKSSARSRLNQSFSLMKLTQLIEQLNYPTEHNDVILKVFIEAQQQIDDEMLLVSKVNKDLNKLY